KVFYRVISEDQDDPNQKGCFMVNTTTELLPCDPFLLEAIQKHKAAMVHYFVELLEKGVRSGEISKGKDLPTLARSLYAFMTGLRVLGKTRPALADSLATIESVLVILD
ncbi:MAG: TetR/AcrR family transcriptional regulator, partial [Bacteroidota bacterium]